MSDNTLLQEKVNQYMIKEVKDDLVVTADDVQYEIVKGEALEVELHPDARKVIIPANMNKLQASYNLLVQFQEEEKFRTYTRKYENYFINDFLTVMGIVVPKYFGQLHVSPVDTSGRPAPNDYMRFPTRYTNDVLETQNGYYGSVKAPVWEDAVIDIDPSGVVSVKAKLKFQSQVNQFLDEIETKLRSTSVVKGAALEIEVLKLGVLAKPINPKTNNGIVLDEKVERIIKNLIIPSLRNTKKTSILFSGSYGTGKTETAIRVGMEAQKIRRTFFYLSNSDVFATLIPYLKNYGPSLVFTEDIDQISGGDRDTRMNDLLNQLDGNELKNVDVTFIFTTNNSDKIHPAMRRPGRIDQIVHFGMCTPVMIAKIFENHIRGAKLIGADEVDYARVGQETPEGLQGAVVAEMARRSVMYAQNLHNGVVDTELVLTAVDSMRDHVEFIKEEQTKDDSIDTALGRIMFNSLVKSMPELVKEFGAGSPFSK